MQTMTKMYTNIFPGSFDPIHISHLSTRAQSEKELGETQIIVCNNGLKDD
jgi:nicotinic acid mononucleotide adenylyltransferase